MTEWCTTRSIAAAVAMGLAKMRSHSEKTRFDVMPSDPALVTFGDEGEEDLLLLGALEQVAQVVQEQERWRSLNYISRACGHTGGLRSMVKAAASSSLRSSGTSRRMKSSRSSCRGWPKTMRYTVNACRRVSI